MEICYGSRGINNFLEVKLENAREVTERGIGFQVKMLEKNEISCLLRPVSGEINGTLRLKYDTKADYVLERMLIRKKPDGELLRNIFRQICDCIMDMEPFLLCADDLILDPAYMFFEEKSGRLHLICVPGYDRDIRKQIKQLLEYLMKMFDYTDRKGVEDLYRLYEIAAQENFEITVFRCYTRKIQENEEKTERKNEEKMEGKMEEKYEEIPEPIYDYDGKKPEEKNLKTVFVTVCWALAAFLLFFFGCKFAFFGKKAIDMWICLGCLVALIVLTVCFAGQKEDKEEEEDIAMEEYRREKEWDWEDFRPEKRTCNLVPLNNGALKAIRLDGEEKITIGRGKKESDYRLPTTQISRVHACIYQDGNKIYLEDLNSTNGTYLNSEGLCAHEKKELHAGDLVAFANEEFFISQGNPAG